MIRTFDIPNNRIIETITPDDVVSQFSPQECLDNIARLNSDQDIENTRHDAVIDKIVVDRQLFQDRYDDGIANGLSI